MYKKQPLESILGSRNKIKLLRLLAKNDEWQFNLASVASQIKTDKGAISRLIKELETAEILEVKRSGKLLMFKLNQSNKFISQIIIPMFKQEEKIK